MLNPFWYKDPESDKDLIDTEYIYWYYHRSWRAPYYWFKFNDRVRMLTKWISLSLLFGFCTFWISVVIAVIGSPVNPYLVWFGLWTIVNLLAVLYFVIKRPDFFV